MAIEPKRLFDLPYYQLENYPLEHCLSSKVNGSWEGVSTKELVDRSNEVSRGLLAMGIKPGDKIGLISNNRYEWHIMDIGILQIGAINVPIYPTISADDYEYIFNHAELKLVVVSSEDILAKVNQIKSKVPSLMGVYTFDSISGEQHWTEIPAKKDGAEQSEVQKLMDGVNSSDLASIIYTSGTTGKPKGVMLSHDNIMSNVVASGFRFPAKHGQKSLSFLPVCHIYERTLLYLYLKEGTSVYFAESMETIGDNIKEVQPEVFSAVPRLLEKVFDKIIAKGQELTGIKKMLFFWAVGLGEKWEPNRANGGFYEWQLGIANKLIFSKWREALGNNVLAIASGSAALQPRLARVFNAAQIPIYEGYGLTETSPVISVNELDREGLMIGTVGRVLDKVEVKFGDDGEILCKGPNVMMGYYKDPEKTREVLTEDGWFHTGDIGEMVGPNKDFLKITDRKKEMFKTSGGKYIAPQIIENMLKESRFIEQAMVIGENRKHPAVLVVPAYEFVMEWCKRHDLVCESNEQIANCEEVQERIWKDVVKITKDLGKWEIPKKMELCKEMWSVENDELTPTLKLKRKRILEKHKEEVDRIYG
ncbi:long-chain fatty acid--CoA ligase [bacterium SCSIO 12643]|nr:long-chain fatty acid--CoA ligase [bacterium SCSIO 12643]